jgi:hypothetical protein
MKAINTTAVKGMGIHITFPSLLFKALLTIKVVPHTTRK